MYDVDAEAPLTTNHSSLGTKERRFRMVLEYDGTGFCGFQRQPVGRSVQGEIENTLAKILGARIEITGSGRTDAGVHSLGQVVHFDITGSIPASGLEQALNSRAGSEWRVHSVEEAPAEFHARFSAVRRTYHYYVSRQPLIPHRARYVTFTDGLLSDARDRMQAALERLLGRHEFAGLALTGSSGTTVRRLERVKVREQGDLLRLELTADAFLRGMVRVIAGLIFEAGRGRQDPDDISRILASGKRTTGTAVAAPNGLFLARVEYADGYPPPTGREQFESFEESSPGGGSENLDEKRETVR